MKKILMSLLILLTVGGVSAVEIDNIYFNKIASEKLDSVSHLITVTPLTRRIAEDKSQLLKGNVYWKNPFRNIQRMLRSIKINKDTPVKTLEFLDSYMEGKLYELNRTGKIAVYTQRPKQAAHFLENISFYYGGRK